jgi:hypothetical protein
LLPAKVCVQRVSSIRTTVSALLKCIASFSDYWKGTNEEEQQKSKDATTMVNTNNSDANNMEKNLQKRGGFATPQCRSSTHQVKKHRQKRQRRNQLVVKTTTAKKKCVTNTHTHNHTHAEEKQLDLFTVISHQLPKMGNDEKTKTNKKRITQQ